MISQLIVLGSSLAFFTPVRQPVAVQDDPAPEVVSQEQLEEWTAEILADIERLREKKFPREVSVSVSSEEKLREYMQQRMDKMSTPERRAADETVAKLLGMIPADMDYEAKVHAMLEEQVGGFYDPEIEGFFLMDRFGGFLAKTILAHELTHALDDQLYDIDGTLAARDDNSDVQFAYSCVVEGSGTALMNVWQLSKMSTLSPEELKEVMGGSQQGMDELADAPPYLWKPLLGVYLRGAAFLNRTTSVMKGQMGSPDLADIDAAFTAPPRSSEQVLHPEKYWNEDERDEPIAVAFELGALPDGWRVLHEDTLGEFGWAMALEPLAERKGLSGPLGMMGAKYTFDASEGWGGDRYVLLGKGDARALFCETVWDTLDDAREFADALDELGEHMKGALEGTARGRGSELRGVGRMMGDLDRRVSYHCWVGLEADDFAPLRAAVSARLVEPSDEQAANAR